MPFPCPQGQFDADNFYQTLLGLGTADVVGTYLVDVFWCVQVRGPCYAWAFSLALFQWASLGPPSWPSLQVLTPC